MTKNEELLIDAIATLFDDYRTESCSAPQCGICIRSKAAVKNINKVVNMVKGETNDHAHHG